VIHRGRRGRLEILKVHPVLGVDPCDKGIISRSGRNCRALDNSSHEQLLLMHADQQRAAAAAAAVARSAAAGEADAMGHSPIKP